jgi:hypothetical protein
MILFTIIIMIIERLACAETGVVHTCNYTGTSTGIQTCTHATCVRVSFKCNYLCQYTCMCELSIKENSSGAGCLWLLVDHDEQAYDVCIQICRVYVLQVGPK